MHRETRASHLVETRVMDIPPPVTDLDIRLECPTPEQPAAVPLAKRLVARFALGAGGRVKVAKSGAFTVKSASVTCPAESKGPCAVAVGVTAKLPKKSGKKAGKSAAKPISLGSSNLSVPAGKTVSVSGKLSRSGLSKLKATKRATATISLSAAVPGGDTANGQPRRHARRAGQEEKEEVARRG